MPHESYEPTSTMIAIVDDDEAVCRAVKRLVRSIGMKANSLTSGQELLDMLEGAPWHR